MSKEYKFTAIVQGPKEYLESGILIKEFVITEEDLEEFQEEEAIKILVNDEIDDWAQRWCKCIVLTEEELNIVKTFLVEK